MRKLLIVSICILGSTMASWACRYTVREIGFSSLSHSVYSIVIINSQADPLSEQYERIRKQLTDSNIRLIILDPSKDQEHPALVSALQQKIPFPTTILWSPSVKRVFRPQSDKLEELVSTILFSPLRIKISDLSFNHFAFTLLIESTKQELNNKAFAILQKSCDDITNRMPNMPKQVTYGAKAIRITSGQFESERVLLWAIGIDQIPETPLALIMYGRGRIIGDILDYESINNQEAFKRLAMIGADCECGLDRKWMLGPQIPMNWSSKTRQLLADELGFDVDNPMVLAEMSHILSKEQITDLETDITFAPEEIDLELLLNGNSETENTEEKSNVEFIMPTILIILGVSVVIIFTGLLILRRKR
ncbi:MAG: hypothetical protein U9N86_12125 [Bacteroidota bacterium]|nr:hypothetical protein [Bacteroidota bacterium]